MDKNNNNADVNSSFTTIFLFSVLFFGIFYGKLIPSYNTYSLLVLIAYVLLLYFIWDFIKQLYSAGQAVILYVIIFIIMPFAMNLLLDFPYARLGSIVLISSYIVSGILETIYEKILKRKISKNYLRRLILIDINIDKSLIKFSYQHIYLNQYMGFSIALMLAVSYFTITYLLFKN